MLIFCWLKGNELSTQLQTLYSSIVAAQYKVDVEMSAHGWVDGTFARLEALKHRRQGEAHPFVIGEERYRQYEDVFRGMAKEAIDKFF